jgi:hypothetical protein
VLQRVPADQRLRRHRPATHPAQQRQSGMHDAVARTPEAL